MNAKINHRDNSYLAQLIGPKAISEKKVDKLAGESTVCIERSIIQSDG